MVIIYSSHTELVDDLQTRDRGGPGDGDVGRDSVFTGWEDGSRGVGGDGRFARCVVGNLQSPRHAEDVLRLHLLKLSQQPARPMYAEQRLLLRLYQ